MIIEKEDSKLMKEDPNGDRKERKNSQIMVVVIICLKIKDGRKSHKSHVFPSKFITLSSFSN